MKTPNLTILFRNVDSRMREDAHGRPRSFASVVSEEIKKMPELTAGEVKFALNSTRKDDEDVHKLAGGALF